MKTNSPIFVDNVLYFASLSCFKEIPFQSPPEDGMCDPDTKRHIKVLTSFFRAPCTAKHMLSREALVQKRWWYKIVRIVRISANAEEQQIFFTKDEISEIRKYSTIVCKAIVSSTGIHMLKTHQCPKFFKVSHTPGPELFT